MIGPSRIPSSVSQVFSLILSLFSSGWGRFSQSSSHGSRVLKEANLPIVGQSECARKNGDKVHEQTMVCVGGGTGTTVCHGDSGGPLVCEEGPGQWVLRGVASWVSDKSCPKDGYSVYVRVGSYLDWIKKQITGAKSLSRYRLRLVCVPTTGRVIHYRNGCVVLLTENARLWLQELATEERQVEVNYPEIKTAIRDKRTNTKLTDSPTAEWTDRCTD